MILKHPVSVIAGPTASGKSAYALDRAVREQGVVINADSLQIYNAMPMLTAAPSAADMALAPHRLYGVLPPDKVITAMDWARMALTVIRETLAEGRVPLIVGGNGFYLKTLMEGLSPIPEIAPEIRVMVQDLLDRMGIDAFFDELKLADPIIAEKIDRQNPQRLMRAMEVFLGTGKPLSHWQSIPAAPLADDLDFQVHLIMPERDTLYDRCNARFDKMIEMGVVEEVRAFDDALMAGKVPIDTPCTHALGFKPLQDYVRGDTDLETAVFLAKNETRHYAKRQTTWLRNQMPAAN